MNHLDHGFKSSIEMDMQFKVRAYHTESHLLSVRIDKVPEIGHWYPESLPQYLKEFVKTFNKEYFNMCMEIFVKETKVINFKYWLNITK